VLLYIGFLGGAFGIGGGAALGTGGGAVVGGDRLAGGELEFEYCETLLT
jgi:hypothetical protein